MMPIVATLAKTAAEAICIRCNETCRSIRSNHCDMVFHKDVHEINSVQKKVELEKARCRGWTSGRYTSGRCTSARSSLPVNMYEIYGNFDFRKWFYGFLWFWTRNLGWRNLPPHPCSLLFAKMTEIRPELPLLPLSRVRPGEPLGEAHPQAHLGQREVPSLSV
jgi:hypothetical protein